MVTNINTLAALYLNGMNADYGNALSSLIGNQTKKDNNSFFTLLNNALSGQTVSSNSNELINTILTDEKSKNQKSNDLLASLMLMLQQGGLNQNNIYYNNLLSDLNAAGTDGKSISNDYSINNILNSMLLSVDNQSSDSDFPEMLGNNYMLNNTLANALAVMTESSLNPLNSENQVLTDTTKSTFEEMRFPSHIMDSINAARQAYDNIKSKIDSINELVGKKTAGNIADNTAADVGNANSANSLNTSNNVANTNNLNNLHSANTSEAAQVNETALNVNSVKTAEEAVQTTAVENIEVDVLAKDDKTFDNIISDELLKVNGVDFVDDNSIVKVNDKSSVLKDNLIAQIKDNIVFMKENGRQTVNMQLTPENLGKLDIKMVFEKGNLSIEITASNPKTQSIILSNITELKAVLQNSLMERTQINAETPKDLYGHNQEQGSYNQEQNHRHQQNENEQDYQLSMYDNSDEDSSIDFYTQLSMLRRQTWK